MSEHCEFVLHWMVPLKTANLLTYLISNLKVIGNVYDSSNWVEHTYPGALYLCIKYMDDPELAMTTSVNLGGDSSNRTALIGAVMGKFNPLFTIIFVGSD
jgi:ADP-ribosylglycohydrolase